MPALQAKQTISTNTGFRCNRCSREATYADDVLEAQEFLHWENVGGYGSVFGDGAELSLTLCQHCVKELLDRFMWTQPE